MNDRLRYGAILVFLGIGWGSTQPLGKIAVSEGYRYFGLIFWQLVICSLVLGAILLVRRKPLPVTAQSLRFAVIIALVGTIIPNSTFYISVGRLPAGIMSILVSTVPLMAFPVALALGMDRFSMLRLAGILFGLAGVALIALPDTSLPEPGMVAFLPLAMVGPLFYAFEGNYVARWGTAGLDAIQAMFGASVVGAIIALPLALASGQWIDPRPPYGLPDLALVVSSATHAVIYTTYVWLASRAGAVFASQCAYFVTLSGVLWAMVLLGERFSNWVWLAMAVMFLGLFLVTPRSRAATTTLIGD